MEFRRWFSRTAGGERLAQAAQVGWQLRAEFQHLATARVLKAQEIGVQRLAAEGFQGGAGRGREQAGLGLEAGSVSSVAQDRVADMGEVDPDLVGTAGIQGAGQKARGRLAVGAGVALQHFPMRYRRPAALAHRAPFSGSRVAIEGCVDGALWPTGRSPDQSEIAAP